MADRTRKRDAAWRARLEYVLARPLLWPLAALALVGVVAAGAWTLALALGERDFLSGIALLILLFLTVWGLEVDIRTRRLRGRNWLVLGVWLASGIGALALEQLGALP